MVDGKWKNIPYNPASALPTQRRVIHLFIHKKSINFFSNDPPLRDDQKTKIFLIIL